MKNTKPQPQGSAAPEAVKASRPEAATVQPVKFTFEFVSGKTRVKRSFEMAHEWSHLSFLHLASLAKEWLSDTVEGDDARQVFVCSYKGIGWTNLIKVHDMLKASPAAIQLICPKQLIKK